MIPLANRDWTILPYDTLSRQLLTYVGMLVGLCCFNLCLYGLFYLAFYFYIPDFKELEKSKVLYTVKNLSKSLVLLFIVIVTLPSVVDVVLYDKWSNSAMFFWGTVYVSVDLLGLLVVPNLSRDTKIHHTVVCILGTINAISDYNVRGLHQALLALTYLSAVPYIVNTYLGLRHLKNKKIQDSLISACFYVYAMSILLNFWAQHLYVFYLIPGGITVAKLVYLLLYYLILKDDIHLMGYFRYKVKDTESKDKDPEPVKDICVKDSAKDSAKDSTKVSDVSDNDEPKSEIFLEDKPKKSRFNWNYFMRLISKRSNESTQLNASQELNPDANSENTPRVEEEAKKDDDKLNEKPNEKPNEKLNEKLNVKPNEITGNEDNTIRIIPLKRDTFPADTFGSALIYINNKDAYQKVKSAIAASNGLLHELPMNLSGRLSCKGQWGHIFELQNISGIDLVFCPSDYQRFLK